MIKVDGVMYDVPVLAVERECEFLDRWAKRNTSGVLKRKLIGVYFNYNMSFLFPTANPAAYKALYKKLSEPKEFHLITTYGEDGEYTYKAYINKLTDKVVRVESSGNVYWSDLSCKFIAESPAKTPL